MSDEIESLQKPTIAINFLTKNNQRLISSAILYQIPGECTTIETKPIIKIEIFEFYDNDQYSKLDSFLHQLGNATLYCPSDILDKTVADSRKIYNILLSCDKEIEIISLKRSSFIKKTETWINLQKLVGKRSHATNTVDSEMPHALGCVECLINNLHLLSTVDDDDNAIGYNNNYELCYGSLDGYMRLDSAAIEAINLLPKSDHPSQFGSIYGILNRCRTKQGSQLLDRWVRHPLLDLNEINQRLDIVHEFVDATHYRNEIRDGPLKAMPDIENVINKMYKKKGGLSEMFRLYVFSKSLPNYVQALQELVGSNSTDNPNSDTQDGDDNMSPGLRNIKNRFLLPLQSITTKFSVFTQLVEHVVDMDALPDLRVNAAHDEALQEIAAEMGKLEDQAERILQDAMNSWASFADIKLEMNSPHGIILRTTRGSDERQLRDNCKSVRILSILKNGVHLTTPALEKISDQYDTIKEEYASSQQGIVEQALETALTYVPLIEAVAAVLAELDVLLAFATAVAVSPGQYVRPTLHERGKGIMKLRSARHPCVELMDSMQQFIANDYDLQRDVSQFQLITGPNMGGKSTYIRAVGCIAVLAQIGMFVPCEEAEMSIVDCILARVGAGDAVQKGVSTFMAEMLESSVILQTATKDSLVIIDELGRGTSTFDGFGIAWAISDYLVTQVKCICLFATHFHELTALEKVHPNAVSNKHVTAHVQNNQVIMLYKLNSGPCTQSFGIHVASSANFPTLVLQSARKKARTLENLDVNTVTPESEYPSKQQRLNETEDTITDITIATNAVKKFHSIKNFDTLPPLTAVNNFKELFGKVSE